MASQEKKPTCVIDLLGNYRCSICNRNTKHNVCPCTPSKYKIHQHRQKLDEMIREDTSKMGKNKIKRFEDEIGATLQEYKNKFPKTIFSSEDNKELTFGKKKGNYTLDHTIPLTAEGFDIINNNIHKLFLFHIDNINPMIKEKNSQKGNKCNKKEINFVLKILNYLNPNQVKEAHYHLSIFRKWSEFATSDSFKTFNLNGQNLTFDKEGEYMERDEETQVLCEEYKLQQVELYIKLLCDEKEKLAKIIEYKKKELQWEKEKEQIYSTEFNRYKSLLVQFAEKNQIPNWLFKFPEKWEDYGEKWENEVGIRLKTEYMNKIEN